MCPAKCFICKLTAKWISKHYLEQDLNNRLSGNPKDYTYSTNLEPITLIHCIKWYN